MATKKVVDLDALISGDIALALEDRQFIPVKLFGKEWRVSNQTNTFINLRAGEGDAKAFAEFIINIIHEDERQDFSTALMQADGITPEVLMKVINHLFEAVADHPTKSSSGSSRSAGTRAAKPKSAVG